MTTNNNGWTACSDIEEAKKIANCNGTTGKKTDLRKIWKNRKNQKEYFASTIAGTYPAHMEKELATA